jgi:hypothetical protein
MTAGTNDLRDDFFSSSGTLQIARFYVAKGFGVIPVRADGSKAPALPKWEPFQERVATDDELAMWFAPGRPVGIGIVCGVVSGNLAVLDFESNDAWLKWSDSLANTNAGAALSVLPIVKTPGGGRHVYCRIQEGWVAGGVLARRSDKSVSIEIRGQGHYVVAPGSPQACHRNNIRYTFESQGWLANSI